jgi:REP element-mobilizing transposase RayT
MSIQNANHPPNGLFYITFTCTKWLSLFEITNSYDLVYNWFNQLRKNNHYIFSYVIMPNHVHCIIGLRGSDNSVNKIVGNAKRFMAYEIVKRLKEYKREDILFELKQAVSEKDRKRGKLHQVFELSFDCKYCFSEEFIIQKLTYIHNNPLKGKWHLAPNAIEYVHSSAKFYATGHHNLFVVDNIHARNDLMFI